MYWLVAVAAINSTVSLYYYLRIVRAMYIEAPFEGATRLPVSTVMSTTLLVATLGVVLLGIFPIFYDIIDQGVHNWLTLFASK